MGHPAYHLSGRLDSFESLGPYERGRVLRLLVEALAQADAYYLARVPTPLLYESGVRYADAGDEWRDVPALLRLKVGDCKDLVAWRVAELRRAGRAAWPRIVLMQSEERPDYYLYHVIVETPRGFEDPSRELGMP